MYELKRDCPIGVFDSGVGGISVLRDLYRLMPQEDYHFFGDSDNAPYGIKTTDEVKELSFDIVDHFIEQNVKAIVIACNTATSAAVRDIRQAHPDLSIIGLEPAIKPAVLRKPNSQILVMATPLTLREQKFQELLAQYKNLADLVLVPAPDLVEYVEKGDLDSPAVMNYLEELLSPYKETADSVVLGCTHFPFVKPAIRKVMGDKQFIIDGGPGASRELQRILRDKELLQPLSHQGSVTFANSEVGTGKIELSKRLFEA
ncbi:glutamate racemase [Liquorilactobacillus mali]|uniref:Glutamate racemase n=1 Tax=Liquorilactobacillus mali KCTC 3596 = DSM 20444 TaxID=1046596 RepID=J1F5J1_9LACO|nr:glutamate racemase [Liquorilactobacillus mali]EJF01598.1 glutamate racemase [Liquorilactobacillus mali KCTC 3596 = DSM 20444]KRN08747.1 glutamate racemase [Liquorilactobacillus mali KCTC 3596 = DSM 20444]QFQ74424.1 glutamate racemase [Liquorilactobacillus mali]